MGIWSSLGATVGTIGGGLLGNLIVPGVGGYVGAAMGGSLGAGIGQEIEGYPEYPNQKQQQQQEYPIQLPDYTEDIVALRPQNRQLLDVSGVEPQTDQDFEQYKNILGEFNRRGMY